MLRWYSNSWFSCRKYTERACRSLDEPLCGWDKAGFVFHHWLCFLCRRFKRQIVQMERDMKDAPRFIEAELEEDHHDHRYCLSDQCKERIIKSMRSGKGE